MCKMMYKIYYYKNNCKINKSINIFYKVKYFNNNKIFKNIIKI
jgi:hypothetical protein